MALAIPLGRFSAGFAENLRVFIELLEEINCDNEQEFLDMIYNAVTRYDIPQVELAKQFRVNKATVHKWAHGKNAPHVNIRPQIAAWIKSRAAMKLEEIEGELRDR